MGGYGRVPETLVDELQKSVEAVQESVKEAISSLKAAEGTWRRVVAIMGG